ncbi:hypothetical protein QBC44DRAFT_267806 [Cladorrhinum sp. PSN332]|nr:hypothetical protein QBC44DRAFT_267806 [Cladorrhinum sp. PSN332]
MSSVKQSKSGPIHFVVSTGTEKAGPELRKFIRSHVMQGKNKGKKLPPRTRKPKTAGAQAPPQVSALAPPSDPDAARLAPCQSRPPSNGFHLYDVQVTIQRNRLSPVACISYADKWIDPRSVEVIFQFSTIAKALLFPLEQCIVFENKAEQWVGPLGVDPAFLHAMIFSAQTFLDSQASPSGLFIGSPSKKALPHLIKAIELLRERFADDADEEERKSLTTVSTITSLAVLAHAAGDASSARNHLEGLYKIVELRGGLESFEGSEKSSVEVLRTDIGIALFHGSRTRFFSGDDGEEGLVELPDLSPLVPGGIVNRVPKGIESSNVNKELVGTWKTLRDFSAVANYASGTRKLISMKTYGDFMISTMYSLLKMDFSGAKGSLDEVVRLGLLAYSASVFLQWKKMTHSRSGPYPYLAGLLRKALKGMGKEVEPELGLWLIMVGAVAVLDVAGEDEQWVGDALRAQMELCGVREWGELRRILERVMWIGLVHDVPGKQVVQGVAKKVAADGR